MHITWDCILCNELSSIKNNIYFAEQKKLESEAAAKAEQTVSDTKKEGAEVTAKDQVEELEKATSETTNQVTGADTAESWTVLRQFILKLYFMFTVY